MGILLMIVWFAVFSMVAGVGVAAWLSSRTGIQRLFGDSEKSLMKAARQPIGARPRLTASAALMLGILIGYLLGQLLAIQVHAQSMAHGTTLL